MLDKVFSFQNPKLTDDEFWQQLKELDELQEELPDFTGFSVQAKLSTGKEVAIPYVRFSRNLPHNKS